MHAKQQFTSRIVTGIFSETRCAGGAITSLVNAGFDRRSLSILGSELEEFRGLTAQLEKSGESDLNLLYCSLIGAFLGAICGWYGASLVPASEFFLPFVPKLAALGGGIAGALLALAAAQLTHLDTPDLEPPTRSKTIRKGLLVSVFVRDSTSRYRAEYLLEKCGAEEIFVVQPQEETSASTA
jgi:hypothetical protein